MFRPTALPCAVARLIALSALSAATPASATIIDSFETGNYSFSYDQVGVSFQSQLPNPAHIISTVRTVELRRFPGSVGTISSWLDVAQNQDDIAMASFPTGAGGDVDFVYSGGPWDLTNGGHYNRMTIRVTGAPFHATILKVRLTDVDDVESQQSFMVPNPQKYHCLLGGFNLVDRTRIKEIRVTLHGELGESVGIANIEMTSASTIGLSYDISTPLVLYACNAPLLGGAALKWRWQVDNANQSTFLGAQLSVDGVSGSGCQTVSFLGADSNPGGGLYGDMALASVDWEAASFDDAFFELRFQTNQNAGYTSESVGPPTVFQGADGFVIEQRTDLSDIDGTPDGRATQRLVVTPHPGQAIWLDFVEALDLGDGYSLSFHYTGETVDTAYPLLEIYATGDWTDVASATGADVHPMASGEGALRAIPTVSRTLTRLELALPADRNSSVDVYDIRGRRVAILPIAAGERSVGWDGADDDGRPVASGVYLARHLDASGAPHTARIVRLR